MIEFVQRRPLLVTIVGILLLALVFTSFPIVPETEQAVVVRFGKPVRVLNRYEAGRRDAIPDPAVEELIVSTSREKGITRRKIGAEEMVERCVLALVNEGAKILEEGIAQRASDIDVVYLTGYGFPPFRGGPMRYADTLGLYNVERAMRRLARTLSV